MPMYDVFLSCPSASSRWGEKVLRAIEEREIPVWFGQRDIAPGENLMDALESAVKASKAVVLVIGPGYGKSSLQNVEVQAALEGAWADPRKRLIPLLIKDAKVPPFLRGRQALVLGEGPKELNMVVDRIAEAIAADAPAQISPPTSAERAALQERLAYIEKVARGLGSEGASSAVLEKSRD